MIIIIDTSNDDHLFQKSLPANLHEKDCIMRRYAFLFICISALVACSHRNNELPVARQGGLSIAISHDVDNQPLIWDSIMYYNQAGNKYGVTKLQYYASNIRLYSNNNIIQQFDSVYYIDAKEQYSSTFLMPTVSAGAYDSVALTIGLQPSRNVSYCLPATIENTAMNWPDVMGGGYHFLKLEGHWMDTASVKGFALHVGKSGFHCQAGFACHLDVKASQVNALNIKMNINEWFRTPAKYDFSLDGVYSMGNDTLMRKIVTNGQDVFSEVR